MSKKKTFICEWCRETLPAKELYSWTGYENYIGPMCKECQRHFKDIEWKLELSKRKQKKIRDLMDCILALKCVAIALIIVIIIMLISR